MRVNKVLHVIPSVGPLRGGPSEMIRNLATGLSRQGIETHVATTNDNGAGKLEVSCGVPVLQDGVTYWYFPRQASFYTFSWPLSTWLAGQVSDFDVVHIHALFSFATVPAAFWARRRFVPYIVRPLGTLNTWGMKNRRPWLKRFSFRFIESRILNHAALIHYTSDQERLEAQTLRITAPAAVIPNVLPQCSDTLTAGRFRARYPRLQGRRIVLFLSRLDRKKGLDLLLHAFATVRADAPDAVLVLAGNCNEDFASELKATCASLGIAPDVLWTGFLIDGEKQAALADADVFVLPSYSENFGIAAAEAMAAGVPVIVSDQVGIHCEVAAAGAGIVVPCQVDDLARALMRLLRDSQLRRSMGRAGACFARQQYSSDAVARKLIHIYNEIAN